MAALPTTVNQETSDSTSGTLSSVTDRADYQYGPEVGVIHGQIGSHPKNWDDTSIMTSGGFSRTMSILECSQDNHNTVGIKEYYSEHNANARSSEFHGYVKFGGKATTYGYTLRYGEFWTQVVYKRCDRVIVGFAIRASGGKNAGVSCGNLYQQPGCVTGVLNPPAGRKLVGLYGDANGVIATNDQGLRGVGLITVPF